MTYTFDGFNYFIRLEVGERLGEVIAQFTKETNIDGGWISGLGTISEVELGFYKLNAKEYQWQTFTGLREITSLNGNLARDETGHLIFHLHGMFADQQYQAVGGHVKDFVTGATAELFVHRSYQPLRRKHDDITGLQLLHLG